MYVLSVLLGQLGLHGTAVELSNRRPWTFGDQFVFISFIEHNNYNYSINPLTHHPSFDASKNDPTIMVLDHQKDNNKFSL